MKPIIGVTADFNYEVVKHCLGEAYVASLRDAGGAVIVLPSGDGAVIDEYLDICDGLVLSGGGDLDPNFWGDLPSWQMGEINPRRDEFELALARQAIERGLPLLGICRGCQLINVAAGGSLIQDIDGELSHVQKAPRDYPFHAIFIEPGSKLLGIIGRDKVRVNSFHHQGVAQPGRDLLISAYAADGTAEAIESTAHSYMLGLQWHPECMGDEVSHRVFQSFVKAAGELRANKTGR